MIAQRSKGILVFGVFHEISVIDDEKYQCRGSFYTCMVAWGPRKEFVAVPGPLVVRQVALVVGQVELFV